MTLQEIFTKVVLHLRKQKVASILANGTCAYRGQYNRMCAVGCLISEEHYTPDIEGKHLERQDVKQAVRESGIQIDDIDTFRLLSRMQGIHDHCYAHNWEDNFANVARSFKLERPA